MPLRCKHRGMLSALDVGEFARMGGKRPALYDA